jgi:hypothetical protein
MHGGLTQLFLVQWQGSTSWQGICGGENCSSHSLDQKEGEREGRVWVGSHCSLQRNAHNDKKTSHKVNRPAQSSTEGTMSVFGRISLHLSPFSFESRIHFRSHLLKFPPTSKNTKLGTKPLNHGSLGSF